MAEDTAPDEPRLHPILSNKEVREAKAKAKKRIEDSRKKAAAQQLEDEEAKRLQAEGYVTGITAADEIVSLTINLAPFTDRIIVDGRAYLHGRTYDMPRHKADAIRDIMWRTQMHEHDVHDENLQTFYGKKHETRMSEKTGAILNAPPTSLA